MALLLGMKWKPGVTTGVLMGWVLAFSACTSIRVDPISPTIQMKHVCIQHNSDVGVRDFLPVVRDGFDRHGISTELVVLGDIPERCEYILTYVAMRAGLMEYLYHAELRLEHKGRKIGYAEYHLVAKGGLDYVAILRSTRAAIDPLIDDLLRANAP